jgi:hypothetical protein
MRNDPIHMLHNACTCDGRDDRSTRCCSAATHAISFAREQNNKGRDVQVAAIREEVAPALGRSDGRGSRGGHRCGERGRSEGEKGAEHEGGTHDGGGLGWECELKLSLAHDAFLTSSVGLRTAPPPIRSEGLIVDGLGLFNETSDWWSEAWERNASGA